jgi:DNA-binding SARP family transcriptional activator/Tfp pilus assembly protein PilF
MELLVMEFGILGPLEVVGDGQRLPVSRPREQRVLAALLLDAGRVVPLDRLVDALFEDRPPDTAAKQVRNCVSALRQRFAAAGAADELIATTPVGYTIRIGAEDLDATVFAHRLARARHAADAGRLDEAVAATRSALALWRGPALAGIGGRRIEAAAAGLNEQRLTALEQCLSYELALGRGTELVAELSELVTEYPLRERLRGQLMVALYRAGRRADALESYRQGRQILVDELGLEPGPRLRALERAILADDRASVDAEAFDGEAAPIEADRPVAVVPAQLPAGATVFTGRTGTLRDLDALMAGDGDRATTVVISAIAGAAGAGKTALAVHWAHRVRSRFSDGQLYLNLRGYASGPPVRPIEALAVFLRALGVPVERAPVDLDEAASMYRSLLAERRMLVVLDNAASPEQVRPLLPGSPGCMVLVTSRDRLAGLVARDGAQVLTLDVLAPDEAYTLLGRTIGAARVAAEPDATRALARLCAYLPLALRIAAAAVTGRPTRRIASYVKELEEGDRISALSITGDEQSAVQAAFDLSYQTLAPADRLVFRRLGLPPGPDVTVGAVAALSGRTPREAAATLDRLVAAHLVDEYTEGRFTFHDLLREYAADRARREDSAAEREAAVRRLLDWYLSQVDAAARLLYPEILRLPATVPEAPGVFDTRADALAWLDAERTNLVAAMEVAAESGPYALAWRIADGLRGYFHLRMCAVDWLSAARAARAAAVRDREPAAEAAAELSLGDLHWRISRYPAAIEHYGRAADAAGRAGRPLVEAAVHGNQGIVYQQSGRLDLAVDRFQRALSIATTIGWRPGVVANLENLAEAYWELGRLEESADQCVRALALMSEAGSPFAKGVLLTGFGEVCHALGRFDEAVDHLTRALTLHREVGNRGGEAETIRVLAAVHRDTGRLAEALDLAEAALAHAQAAGDRRYEADALNTVASVTRISDPQQAARTYWSALELAREIGNRYPEAEALIGLAVTGPTRELARGYAEEGLAVARQIGYRILEGDALAVLADIERDRPEVSTKYAERARAIRSETGHRPVDPIRAP